MADRLHQFLGHPADGRQHLTQGKAGEHPTPLLDAVFTLAGGPFFEGMIDLVADPAGLLDGFPHGKDEAGDGHLRPLLQVQTMGMVLSDAIAAAGFSEVGLTFPGVNEDDGHLRLVAVALPDHLGGGAKLSGGPVDGRGGAKAAELKFEDGGRMAVGKGDGIQFPKAVTTAKVVSEFRILVAKDAAVSELEMAGKEGTDTKFGGGTNDRKGGGLDADLAGALPFPSAADGKALRPTEVFTVVGMDQFWFSVIGGGRRRIQTKTFRVFWRPPRNKPRRCKGLGRGYPTRTTRRRRRISDGRPNPIRTDRFR